jgi:predicted RNase H-like nuclease (RuvC/YqgF family)
MHFGFFFKKREKTFFHNGRFFIMMRKKQNGEKNQMFNRTQFKIKTNALVGVVKEAVAEFGDKFQEQSVTAKEQEKRMMFQLDRELRENDARIEGWKKKKKNAQERLNEQRKQTDHYRKLFEEHQRAQRSIEEEIEGYGQSIRGLVKRSTKIQTDLNRTHRDFVNLKEEMIAEEAEPVVRLSTRLSSGKTGNAMESLIEAMHEMVDAAGSELGRTEKTIQYRYRYPVTGSVYFFKISSDRSNRRMSIYKKTGPLREDVTIIAVGEGNLIPYNGQWKESILDIYTIMETAGKHLHSLSVERVEAK